MTQPYLPMLDGRSIPQLGLGTWQSPQEEAAAIVRTAIDLGYRHIDTAMIYQNEQGVGEGIRAAAVPREDLFVTTKLWNTDQGYDSALAAFDASLDRLGLDYLDLYLIHWPAPARDLYVDSWRALIRLQEEGRVRSIGVSNFNADHLERILQETGVSPVINQVELHPAFQQRPLRAAHDRLGVLIESWSPLGQGKLLETPALRDIAQKHGRTVAQVILRWHLQSGLVVIPKSVRETRLRENFDLFDFTLDAEDMAAIEAIDDPQGRIGPNPQDANF